MALRYAATCDECHRPMRPGTVVDFFADGKGGYRYIHAGMCEQAPAVERKSSRPRFDLRECSNDRCGGAAGIGFPRGTAPARCPDCGAEWGWEMAA